MDAYGFWILATSDCIHSTALLHLATRAPTSRAESHRHHRGQEPKSLEEPWLGLRYHINTWMSLPLSPGQASSHTSIDHGQKGVPLAGSWDESVDKRIHKWDETTIELLLTTRPFARQCLPPNKNVCVGDSSWSLSEQWSEKTSEMHEMHQEAGAFFGTKWLFHQDGVLGAISVKHRQSNLTLWLCQILNVTLFVLT